MVGAKNDFTHGVTMAVADRPADDADDAHPGHQAFVAELWDRDVADFFELGHQLL